MTQQNKMEFTAALCKQFDEMRQAGKNENIQKNVYIKMMCWLYYKFERIMPFLGRDILPKVLYEGNNITNHELTFLRILSSMGVDILLVETKSDDSYRRLDPDSNWSQKIRENGTRPFPQDYSLKNLRKEAARQAASNSPRPALQRQPQPWMASASQSVQLSSATVPPLKQTAQRQPIQTQQLVAHPQQRFPVSSQKGLDVGSRFPAPGISACTNAWMKEAALSQVLVPPVARGDDRSYFYNAFIRMNGVNDKLTYVNELYQMYQNLAANQRKVLVIDGAVPIPDPEELQKIRRRNYKSADELIIDLAGNLPACASVELQRSIQRSFVRTMKEAAEAETAATAAMTAVR